ncbi:PID-CTERM protein-sorting domain-containing protein [Pontibacter sp. H249]|uniref:PID-CTERM protein-sorting domain-containing protein n=1 Tax=Pontibacter sp. H249 TaxID=3133420 RepID=UPI0030BE2133
MKKLLINSMFIVGALLLTSSLDASAQRNGHDNGNGNGHGYDDGPGQGPGNGNGYGHNKPGGVPIDGGASLLLAAGAAYGLKKVRDYRNSSKSENLDV